MSIIAGSGSGAHFVFVCETHQNVKLLTTALPKRFDYNKHLLALVVCSIERRNCMLHSSNDCPGEDALRDFLTSIFEEDDYYKAMTFKQGIKQQKNFIDELCLQLY